jgi:hypothetical protein
MKNIFIFITKLWNKVISLYFNAILKLKIMAFRTFVENTYRLNYNNINGTIFCNLINANMVTNNNNHPTNVNVLFSYIRNGVSNDITISLEFIRSINSPHTINKSINHNTFPNLPLSDINKITTDILWLYNNNNIQNHIINQYNNLYP